METNILSIVVLFNIIWTLALSLIYLFLYKQYKEVYMGIWGFAWLLSSLRISMDFYRYQLDDVLALFSINLFVSAAAVLLQLLGMYHLKETRIHLRCVIGAVAAVALAYVGKYYGFSFHLYITPLIIYTSVAYIWIGVSFLRFWRFTGMGKKITGNSFIFVGLINLTYPFNAIGDNLTIAAIFYSVGLIPWLGAVIGILLLYFEKTRIDLLSNETRFRRLIENAKDVVFRFSLIGGGRFDYISPSLQQITGYAPKELYKFPHLVSDLIGRDYKKLLEEIEADEGGQLKTFKIYTKDKNEVWLEQSIVPIYNQLGKIEAVEGILRDVTERKKLEREMVRLDSLKLTGETAAGIAHEVRNPMTTVRGFLQIMERKPLFKEYIEVIKLMITELDRANSIISNFLTFSRVQKPQLKVQNLTSVITSIMPLVESNALYTGKSIKISLEDTPDFEFDENELKQMVLNLVQNGLEAMVSGGTLEINIFHTNDTIKLVIKDQGRGMDPAHLEKLGTPFFTTKEQGTGLGLAICYGIAAKHGATISVDSNQEGTSFTIAFKQKP